MTFNFSRPTWLSSLLLFTLGVTCTLSVDAQTAESRPLAIVMDRPAKAWVETLPLGNGRIGIMPDGGIARETVVLNEISLWSGAPQDADNPAAYESLDKIRQLLFEGKNDEAQDLMYSTFVCKGAGSGLGSGKDVPYGSYQMLGLLNIDYTYAGRPDTAAYSHYQRKLQLDNALSECGFQLGEVNYHREYLTSFSDDVAIIRLTANKGRHISFKLTFDRPERMAVSVEENDLVMQGAMNNGSGGDGMHYMARATIVSKGGKRIAGEQMVGIENADEALIYLSMTTDYKNPRHTFTNRSLLVKAIKSGYSRSLLSHERQFGAWFNRATLDLGRNIEREGLTTNRRLTEFAKSGNDNGLIELYFQYGRYLLICSTRPGLLPPNLQGLWANTLQTPWNGDYHMNINLQMNLWPAEVTNLSELHSPLIELTKSLVEPGRKSAKAFYNANGWVTHILTNIWGYTSPGEHPSWGATNTAGAWMCQHLWEHYLFTNDTAYLRSVYPVLKESALFFSEMLVKEPQHGWLVTAPTTSPENSFILPNGKTAAICMGSTMDNQLVREQFGYVAEAARILNTDSDFALKLQQLSAQLPPHQIGKYGQLQEWLDDYQEAEPQHRHVSQLYGLHPGNQITPEGTPELAQAARVTLDRRGDGGTGWSRAWKVNHWARLADGNRAYKLLSQLLVPVATDGYDYGPQAGGTYPNLFCAHPPFQIDGNFGGCAGIAEMLLQSHSGYIELLPALPDAWATGSFSGFKVRGNGVVDASWENKSLKQVKLTAQSHSLFRFKFPVGAKTVLVNGKPISLPSKGDMLEAELNKDDILELNW